MGFFDIAILCDEDDDTDDVTIKKYVDGKLSSIKGTSDRTNIYFYNKAGKLHRSEGQPAVIKTDGSEEWYINGELHRDNNLPAIIKASGYKAWYSHGKLYRSDGLHTIETSTGDREWRTNIYSLHRENDLPAVINTEYDYKEWWKDGVRYRVEGKREW